MITGYNTDVEHDGVVYHVQTEDKGLQTPVILSLVYTGGAILASKRAPYDDLITSGFDQNVLVERLQRQHKLICAAINAGRIEELKRMGATASQPAAGGTPDAPVPPVDASANIIAASEPPVPVTGERFTVSTEAEESLRVSLLDEKPLRAGESVTLRLEVTKRTDNGRVPAPKANITVKVLGSTFQPSSAYSTTDSLGRSAISVMLPGFTSGRGAILIRAEADGEVADLRRVIQPS
jgi:hypothetical protein